MKPDDSLNVVQSAAKRARSRPEFLGWVLAQYENLEQLPEDNLRNQLKVDVENWPRLQLCLRPRTETFLPDVTQIAQAFGVDRATLAAVIRRVEAVEVIRASRQQGEAGSLLAARTRKSTRRSANREVSSDE